MGNVVVARMHFAGGDPSEWRTTSWVLATRIYTCIGGQVLSPHANTLLTLSIMPTSANRIHNNADEKGNFNRQVSSFRDAIQPGGQFPPEKGMAATFI